MDFYNNIADNYDEMTNLNRRLDNIEHFVVRIKEKYDIKSALDAACGTGIYTIKMAQKGIDAVGADISAGMIEKAKILAAKSNVGPRWINCSMQELSGHINEKFDVILCLGNSIPHILNMDELDQTFEGFAQLLQPNGTVLIGLLNYSKILAKKKRLVAVTKKGDNEYIRFYDFLPDLIQFNLLKINWQGDKSQQELTSTKLFPYTPEMVYDRLKQKFNNVNMYCDLQFNPFDSAESDSVLFEAYQG